MFLDGWVFAALAATIAGGSFVSELNLSDFKQGVVSSMTQIGTLAGGLLIGYITDVAGRKPMFIVDLVLFVVADLMMFTVNAFWVVLVLEFVVGTAIGGDYAIGSPLLGEFTPSKKRGNYLGILEILWNIGYVISFAVGYLVLTNYPGAWHFILASATVPAVIILAMRHGLPESPRWLLSKGREDEARQVLESFGGVRNVDEFIAQEQKEQTRWRILFSRDYLSRTIFAAVFWICIVVPYFGLTFFQTKVLKLIGLGNAMGSAVIGTIIALIGASIGWYLVDRVGRRPLLIIPMFATAGFLAVVALNEILHLSAAVTAVCFFLYLLFYGVMSILPGIYPIEVFPTSVRTSGEGVASGSSRAGAAAGTLALPVALGHFGLGPTLLGLAVIALIGGVTSLILAPETRGRSLSETGARRGSKTAIDAAERQAA
jgi:putative MFS transporter